jgi:predicted NBD/HSP70 family sugar kinase
MLFAPEPRNLAARTRKVWSYMKERHGINNTHIKNRNRGIVLQYIARDERLSRIDIAKRIGLTKMAVTNIVGELIGDGYVTERDIAENAAVGRNPVILDVADSAPYAIGLYLSRTHVSVMAATIKLQPLYQEELPLEKETGDSLMEKLYCLTERALAHQKINTPRSAPLGIGVAAIGPLDASAGVILKPTNFFGIQNLNVVCLLQSRFGLPVFLENDMNAAALAEKLYGFGKPYANFIYMGIANGIGSGIVSDGKLYQGTSGFVGEIGHMSIKYDGDLCDCGNRGCLELYANSPVILHRLREITGDPTLTPRDFEELSKRGDCGAVLEETADSLTTALVNMVNILDPECVIIGHEGVYLPDRYLNRMEEQVQARILSGGYKSIPVIRSSFGGKAPLSGSVCCVLQKLFEGHIFTSNKGEDTDV